MFKRLFFVLTLALMLSFSATQLNVISTHAYAAPDLSGELTKMEGKTVIGDAGAKDKIRGMSKDGIDIVGIVVMAAVTISGLWVGIKFTGAGENAQQKAILKVALIFHVLGLIFLANYFNMVSFVFKNMGNIFK